MYIAETGINMTTKKAPKAKTKKNNDLWKAPSTFPYAVIRTGSKQYCVSEGEHLLVDKLDLQPGDSFKDAEVLYLASAESSVQVGKPTVSGAQVEFEVLQNTLGKKIQIRHHIRRHNSRKTTGHRQPQTRLLVKKISG